MAYSTQLNESSSNIAEAKALLFGIKWCIQQGLTQIELETGSVVLLSYIKEVFKIPWQLTNIIIEIQRALQGMNWSIHHCYREANQVADNQASLSFTQHNEQIYLSTEDLPKHVRGLLNMDKWRILSLRVRIKKQHEILHGDII